MAITNGRGDANKRLILHKYRLQPVMYTRPLNGKVLQCCCGNPVEERYYQFDAMDRISGRPIDILYAGDHCANRLIELSADLALELGEPPFPKLAFFDPLAAPPRNAHAGGDHAGNTLSAPGVVMAPLNIEIERAIMLTLICWNATPRPGSVFSQLLDEMRRFPTRPLYESKVRSVNTAIGGKAGRKLTNMLGELRQRNPTLRHYEFPLMKAILSTANPPVDIHL
jgi:hypothetical protein